MADEIDIAQQRQLEDTERAVRSARQDLAAGTPGECSLCGEWSGRLVNDACAPCRDRYKLP